MDIIYILIPVTLCFIGVGIYLFFWSVKSGQYDDVDSPASRILFDDDAPTSNQNNSEQNPLSEGTSPSKDDQNTKSVDKQP